MKAVVAAFNQEKALEGAFSVITNLRMELFEALVTSIMPEPRLDPAHAAPIHYIQQGHGQANQGHCCNKQKGSYACINFAL